MPKRKNYTIPGAASLNRIDELLGKGTWAPTPPTNPHIELLHSLPSVSVAAQQNVGAAIIRPLVVPEQSHLTAMMQDLATLSILKMYARLPSTWCSFDLWHARDTLRGK
ncbi:MAG TPA: hypothetical protein VJ836_05025 [Candidatus Saccharimonadales bacterium]|nr:hypothetical protein [Candidatus Saccharimonadales bacterium]